MTQDEIIEMACQTFGGVIKKEERDNFIAFAKLVEKKSIQPYLPYKEKIESMERAYDAHFKKAIR